MLSTAGHEEAARLKTRALQSAISSSASFSSIATDLNGVIQIFNVGAERMLGYTAAEVVNKITPEDMSDPQEVIAHAKALSTELGIVITPGFEALGFKASRGIEDIYELTYVRKDGTRFPAVVSVTALRDAQAVVIGYLLIGTDNTARKLVEDGQIMAAVAAAAELAAIQGAVSEAAIIAVTDLTGKIEQVNDNLVRISKYSREELIGQDHRLLNSGLHSKEFIRDLWCTIASGKVWRHDLHNRAKDGSLYWVDTTIVPVLDARGKPVKYIAVRFDITARKQAEEALLKPGALQTAIFNSANFSSIATDAKGVIQIFNVGAERMLGYTAAEVMNKITPADISDPTELIARAKTLSAELGTPITPGFEALVFKASRGIEDIYELTYIRKDGSRFPALVSVTALRDAQDTIIGYLLIGTDNTTRKLVEAEQKKLDQRLRDQQFYTRSLIESNIDALMTTDPSGIITDVNKQMEALTGCTRDELIGAPFKGYFTDPERAEAGIKLVLSEKKVTDYELTARARDGKETVVSYNATTFYDRDRTLQGVFAAARDVTERRRFELELKQAKADAESASRTKSDFLASMSHEIRTPMNAIMGIADLLAKTPLSAEQNKYVQIFRRAGDNLLNLINDILDLSKVESSQLELERTGFSLSDLLGKVTEMVAARAEEKGLALVCEIAPDVPNELIGDPTRLQQVLLNLVGNAIKFTEWGEVSMRVTLDGDSSVPIALRFTISDTGVGIATENLGRVFERFTQADSSTTRRFGGSGLGLTISKRLAEAMGGRIGVESILAKGSVFSLVVPFEIWASATLRATLPPGSELAQTLPSLRILLAEDSADNCTIAMAYLEGTPYQVEIAETGAIACEMFAAGRYDLVLMDRQMPVMDGLTATRKIRAWEKANDRAPTPIIALTASALKGDREKCMAAGCTAFLTKPIKQEVLLRAIKERSLVGPTAPKEESKRKTPSLLLAHPAIAARIPKYLQNRRKDVVTLLQALARGELETLKTLGHSMHGSGESFGFRGLTRIGAALEQHATRGDLDAARKCVDELSTYLDSVSQRPHEGLDAVAEHPLRHPPSEPRDGTQRSKGLSTSKIARTIVLIDDDDDTREVFREILEQDGHHVYEARAGVAGLALILAESPDVAIVDLDLGMPDMDGYEVARQVRAAGRGVWLVTMSGYGTESARSSSLLAGFDTHMTKPIDMDLVNRMLDSLPARES